MPERNPTETTNLDIYGNAALPWSRVRDLLAVDPATLDDPGDRLTYLSTVRPDGRPHTAGIGAMWYDGDMYIVSGPNTRKSKNLAQNPNSTLAVHLPGIDLILEGTAARVTDTPSLEALAAVYNAGGWPCTVEGDAFTAPYSAPSAGPPPWYLYRFTFGTAFAVASAEPHGATRWRFGA
jgi:hypothetical protein